MIHATVSTFARSKGSKNLRFGLNAWRIVQRRRQLEERRIAEAHNYISPTEPTKIEALRLYRLLLKSAEKTFRYTSQEYFRRKLRHEYVVTAAKTSSRVRGIMYEKGKWMLANRMGGLL